MAHMSAKEVLAKFQEFGHDLNPDKQAYKVSVAGHTCTVYPPKEGDKPQRVVEIRAESIEQFIAKGWTVEPKEDDKEKKDEGQIPGGRPSRGQAGQRAADGAAPAGEGTHTHVGGSGEDAAPEANDSPKGRR